MKINDGTKTTASQPVPIPAGLACSFCKNHIAEMEEHECPVCGVIVCEDCEGCSCDLEPPIGLVVEVATKELDALPHIDRIKGRKYVVLTVSDWIGDLLHVDGAVEALFMKPPVCEELTRLQIQPSLRVSLGLMEHQAHRDKEIQSQVPSEERGWFIDVVPFHRDYLATVFSSDNAPGLPN